MHENAVSSGAYNLLLDLLFCGQVIPMRFDPGNRIPPLRCSFPLLIIFPEREQVSKRATKLHPRKCKTGHSPKVTTPGRKTKPQAEAQGIAG